MSAPPCADAESGPPAAMKTAMRKRVECGIGSLALKARPFAEHELEDDGAKYFTEQSARPGDSCQAVFPVTTGPFARSGRGWGSTRSSPPSGGGGASGRADR